MPELTSNLIYPILCRALQTVLESAPTFLCGLVLAGLARGMIGPEALRRWFTDDPRIGPLRACMIGLLLPVGSFGVLPLAWELRRAGVARAAVLSFLLSAPLANPISLASAFQKLESQGAWAVGTFLALLLGALALVAGLGALLGRWLPEPAGPAPDLPPVPASALRRLMVAGLSAGRGVTGTLLLFLMIGIIGSGLLALYPGGALEHAALDRSLGAPAHMALVALPAQVAPMHGATLLCDMLFMGVPLGSIFVFLLLGIGVNIGTIVWIARAYGLRVMVAVVLVLIGATLAVGYAVPISMPNLTADATQRRHFLEIDTTSGAEVAWTRAVKESVLDDKEGPNLLGIATWTALVGLALVGLVARALGERGTVPYQMTRPAEQPGAGPNPIWNRHVAAGQLALAGAAVILVLGVAGVYIAYPSPEAVLEEMNTVQIELNLTLKAKPLVRQDALRLVDRWQRLQNKLSFGDFLRRGRFTSPLRQPNEELRLGIEQLRAALVEMKPPEEVNALYADARKSATRCRQALASGR